MHVEATWRRDSMPDSAGRGQTENEWSATAAFAPESALGFVANVRWQDGTGRLKSQERLANLLLTWRSNDRSQVAFNWSRRTSTAPLYETSETVYGLDLQMWLPGDYRLSGSARELSGQGGTAYRSYSLTVEKSF
jgi:hypothetical protein